LSEEKTIFGKLIGATEDRLEVLDLETELVHSIPTMSIIDIRHEGYEGVVVTYFPLLLLSKEVH
jgi:hypothetical protein